MLSSSPRGLRSTRSAGLVLALASSLCGCASSYMRFHFAAVDPSAEDPMLEFYRVTIDAGSGNSRSEFQTGYYDADALHQLYGQVSDEGAQRPDEGKSVGAVVVQFDPTTRAYRIVEQDERFTVVYGTNADAVAQQIAAFADADDTGRMLGGLMAAALGRERFASLYSARVGSEEKRQAAAALEAELGKMATEAGALVDAKGLLEKLKTVMRRALQEAVRRLGSGVALDPQFDEALRQAKTVHAAESSRAR